jgi:replicative DNA helicase
LSDPISERYILSCIYNYGDDAYYEISDIICENCFLAEFNVYFFKCLKHAIVNQELKKIDVGTIQAAANSLKIENIINRKDVASHIKNVIAHQTSVDNVRTLAIKLKKLYIGRLMKSEMENAIEQIIQINGEEETGSILGIADQITYKISDKINDNSNNPTNLGEYIEEYYNDIKNREIKSVGISTGYPIYDDCIGGGFRPASVSLIGARTKNGKSLIGTNIGLHVAGNLKIPVLVLDTELTLEEHINRLVALGSRTPPKLLETGKFKEEQKYQSNVLSFVEKIKKHQVNYFHRTVSNKPFSEHLAVIRRWIAKHVGINADGSANPCLIIYDWLRPQFTAESAKLQENQSMGLMMSELHNVAVKYKIPILSFVQLNRDGITTEGTEVIAQSDRIGWFCSNFSIFKAKSPEEMAEDSEENGNCKLIPIVARHGPGIEQGNYINFTFDRKCLRITEGKTKFQIQNEQRGNSS